MNNSQPVRIFSPEEEKPAFQKWEDENQKEPDEAKPEMTDSEIIALEMRLYYKQHGTGEDDGYCSDDHKGCDLID